MCAQITVAPCPDECGREAPTCHEREAVSSRTHPSPKDKQVWLKAGDKIESTIQGLGTLSFDLA